MTNVEGGMPRALGFTRTVVLFPLTRLVIAAFLLAVAFVLRDVIANGILALPPTPSR